MRDKNLRPNLYIIAGSNGAGKTTFAPNQPLADSWTIFDNSGDVPRMIAFEESGKTEILDPDLFDVLLKCKEEQ